ncbi:hypothetical protein pEaSNUABM54_00103 [Erwinia phage pEa_SNUABM_54]|nr:hypothetical protein pEaSNUABM54_00103 [Erwinia phage pEa_SNUABM_54]
MRYGEELRLRLSMLEEQINTFMNLSGAFSQMFPTMNNPMYSSMDGMRARVSGMRAELLEHEFNFGSAIHENYLDDYSMIRKLKEITKDDSIELSEIVWMGEVEPKQRISDGTLTALAHRTLWVLDGAIEFSLPAVEFKYHPLYGIEQESVMSIPSMSVEHRHRAARGVIPRIGINDFIDVLNKHTGLTLTYEEWVADEEQSVRDDWMRCAPKSLSAIRHAVFDRYKDFEYSSDTEKRDFFRKCDYVNNDMCRTLSGWPTSKHVDAYNRARESYRRYYFKLKEIGLEELWADVEITEPPTQETNDAS